MISTPNNVHSTCREARQNTDQQVAIPRFSNSAGQRSRPSDSQLVDADPSVTTSLSTMDQCLECCLYIRLPHQGFSHQNSLCSSGLNPIEISAMEQSRFAHQKNLLLRQWLSELGRERFGCC